jgi:hypothetical protein
MSNTVIQIKKSGETGNVPDANGLNYGELAINYNDGIIYYKNQADQIKTIRLQDVFESVNVNGTLLVPTSASDILSFKSEGGITLTGYSSNDNIIIGETLTPLINTSLSQSNAAYAHANAAYNTANTLSANISDYYPTANDYGYLYETMAYQTFGDEDKQISFDMTMEPVIPRGYFLTKNFGHLT